MVRHKKDGESKYIATNMRPCRESDFKDRNYNNITKLGDLNMFLCPDIE